MEKYLKPLIVLSLIVFAFAAYAVFQTAYTLSNLSELSAQEAADKAITYISSHGGTGAALIDVTEESGLYKIHIRVGQNEGYLYISKDGRILFQQATFMDGSAGNATPTPAVSIPKSDRPDVKVFVMSYCPYGLQAQKMVLPVYDLLKDKIDIGVYFVDYAMHGKQELDENLRQYCMQSDNQSQYFDYLDCFTKSGDCDSCIAEAGVNSEELASCVAGTDAAYNVSGQYNDQSTWRGGTYPVFDIHNDLCELYGVTGSPTIIINGVKVSVNPRSPENFKQIICSAFNTPPEECNQTLSTTAPSSGFN